MNRFGLILDDYYDIVDIDLDSFSFIFSSYDDAKKEVKKQFEENDNKFRIIEIKESKNDYK